MKHSLTTSDAAQFIGKSAHWLYVNAERLQIPRYRIGGRWVYFEEDLNEWFLNQKVLQEGSARPINRKTRSGMYVQF